MGTQSLDWDEIRDYYEVGHGKRACQARFGFSDWDWHAAIGRGVIAPRTKGQPVLASARRELIARLRSSGLSYTVISRRLGVSKSTVAYHARRLGIPADDACGRRYDWAQVQNAIDRGATVAELIEEFGFARASYSQAVRRGAITPRSAVTPIEQLLVAGRPRNRGHLKARLIGAGLKENRCEQCGITEWMGKPLSMELHHVNGDGTDNRLENLQLLCGNCHSQTDNWGGRGVQRQRPLAA